MPGDLEGSPALTFAPLPLPDDYIAEPGTLAAMMERRYEAYKAHVVKPFFRDHFARLDRQIVLVDALSALNSGPEAMRDLQRGLNEVLAAFRSAATTAQHAVPSAHRQDPDRRDQGRPPASSRPRPAGGDPPASDAGAIARAEIRARRSMSSRSPPCAPPARPQSNRAATRSTPSSERALGGRNLDGQTFDGETEAAVFPGQLPADPA